MFAVSLQNRNSEIVAFSSEVCPVSPANQILSYTMYCLSLKEDLYATDWIVTSVMGQLFKEKQKITQREIEFQFIYVWLSLFITIFLDTTLNWCVQHLSL